MRLDSLIGMSNAEVKHMLKNCAWREVTVGRVGVAAKAVYAKRAG